MTQLEKGSSTGDSPVLEPSGVPAEERFQPVKVLIGVAGMIAIVYGMLFVFLLFSNEPQIFLDSKLIIGLVAVVVGVGGAGGFFYSLNMAVEGLPAKLSRGAMPYAYILPGFGLITLMLIYPTVQTINYSFANSDSTAYVGFQNYVDVFADEDFRISIINNLLWLFIVPAVTVALGVIVAVLADKLSSRGEQISKSLIFLPMAISFVGASAIWSLIYDFQVGDNQIGILNAIWQIFGEPKAWLDISTGRLNSLLLMVILIWLQVGFAMILLSSAIKGVPEDTLEAARIDGANELQIFWRVVIPQVKGTIITVYITVVILVLKVFDIVYVLTNGRFETNVIANLFYNEAFANNQFGRGSAIVVILLIAVLPILIYQVRHFRAEEANR